MNRLTSSTHHLFSYMLLIFPFISIVYPIGMFHEANWPIFGLWLCAGANLMLQKESLRAGFLPITLFALASLEILGIFQNGLVSLVGINEVREGGLTFLSAAIILTTFKPKDNVPSWIIPILYSIITIFGFYGWKYLGWKTYVFLDISSFSTLASIPMYMRFRNSVAENLKSKWDAFYVALFLFLMYYADNDAAIVACCCAAIFVFLLPLAKQHFKFLPKNDGFYIIGGLSAIALLVLLSWKIFPYLPSQLQSRTLLGIVTVLQYFDNFNISKFMHVIFGYGWGSFQEFPLLNLFNIENFSVYSNGDYNPNWEFLERNLLHTHNLVLETLVSSGVIGVIILLTGIYKWVQNIDAKDWSGRFFITSYLILLCAWFQTPPVLIFCLFAMLCIKEKITYKIRVPRLISCGLGLTLIFFAITEFWASHSLLKHKFNNIKNFKEDSLAFINDPAHTYEKIGTYKVSNRIMSFATATVQDAKSPSPEIEEGIIMLVEDYLESYQKRNVVSSVHIINLCNSYVTLKNISIDTKSKFFQVFKAALINHLERFPERADMAIGYLNFCFNSLQSTSELDFIVKVILKANPLHPVGLWFSALAELSRGINKQQAIMNMRKAISSGLLRFMPIEKELLQQLGIQQ